jgi:DNA-directed RNA polymerase subunit RPC12/RpoP
MSGAYRCDDCGEFFEGDATAEIETTLLRGDVELCTTCAREFKARYRND